MTNKHEYVILLGREKAFKSATTVLEEKVEEFMSDGWLPNGGVVVDSNDTLYQAMTRGPGASLHVVR